VLSQLHTGGGDEYYGRERGGAVIVNINNVDYSAALIDAPAQVIERTLNKPSVCTLALDCGTTGLALPLRNQTISVTAANGAVLFTGYLATDPVAEYAGATTTGPAYRMIVAATSDEYVLDRQPLPAINGGVNQSAGEMLTALTSRLDTREMSLEGIGTGPAVATFRPDAARSWSENAGQLAALGRTAYRAIAGAVSMSEVGTVTHTLDGATLDANSLNIQSTRTLANDVTLTGAEEPYAYALDLFEGDGATLAFQLTEKEFSVAHQTVLSDSFTAAALNLQWWQLADPGSHISIATGGLGISGGTGTDGQTTLSAIDPLELGGTIVLEAGNVSLAAGSGGILLGLFTGQIEMANCFAGFNVTTSSGALLLAPVVNGEKVGTVFTLTPLHDYTLRIRLHFPELVRALATYYSLGDTGVVANGGGLTTSPALIEFEMQDSASVTDTPATVLYDGAVAASAVPATATFAAVDSTTMSGAIGYVTVTRPTTAWATSIPPGGTEETRRLGTAVQGAQCAITSGKLTFYAAYTPVAGELIKLRYRTLQRAVARVADAASQASESEGQPASGVPGVAQWAGKVEHPAARCSADCEAACAAVLDFSTSRAAAWKGKVTGVNLQELSTGDVWPGDLISLAVPFATASNAAQSLLARVVRITNGSGYPDLLTYDITLANEWADCLSLTLNDTAAADAVLPQTAELAIGQAAAAIPLLDFTAISTSAISVTAGVTPPAGGGFEVRSQDANFGVNASGQVNPQGLVLRSPVANFDIPRGAQQEEFFVRMYDGATPPNYSRASAAIFTDVPV
jgi:hypothetical protein